MSDNETSKKWLDAIQSTLDWTWDNVTDEALNDGFSTYDPEAKERDAKKASVAAMNAAYTDTWDAIEADSVRQDEVIVEPDGGGGVRIRVFFRIGRHRSVARLWHPGGGDIAYVVEPGAGNAGFSIRYEHTVDDANADNDVHAQRDVHADANANAYAHQHLDAAADVDAL